LNQQHEHNVFVNIGEIAGMKGMAVAQHVQKSISKDGIMQQDGPGMEIKTVCGREAADEPTGMYLRRVLISIPGIILIAQV
jgi:hypothetical protein